MPLVYYLLIKPLSYFPSRLLYLISDFLLYPVIFLLAGYRKKVVVNNVKMAFPDLSAKGVNRIVSRFFHHFCDLMVESIMLFSISKEDAIKRCKLVNPEIFQPYYDQGRSVAFAGGHYNNWELLAVAIAPQTMHQVDAIYAPLTNPFMENKIKSSRSKFGLRMTPKKETAQFIEDTKAEKTAMIFAIDQAPFRKQKAYWMSFFNKETAVAFGTERYAVKYDWPVFFCKINKVKRGYYEMKFELVTDTPTKCKEGWITQKLTRIMEDQIKESPEYWLWTHKRWKRKRPTDQEMQPDLL